MYYIYIFFLAKGSKIQKISKSGKPLIPGFPDDGSHTILNIATVTTAQKMHLK
jgi:hypothetical protein